MNLPSRMKITNCFRYQDIETSCTAAYYMYDIRVSAQFGQMTTNYSNLLNYRIIFLSQMYMYSYH